jgi:hypothetical protein
MSVMSSLLLHMHKQVSARTVDLFNTWIELSLESWVSLIASSSCVCVYYDPTPNSNILFSMTRNMIADAQLEF